jgi:CHAT domain-containing protein
LLVGLTAASRMEQRAGRLDSARALLRVEVEESRTAANPSLFPDALVRSATVSEEEGDHAAAMQLAHAALAASERISDVSLRERALANSRAGEGAILVNDDPRRANDSLTTAIRFYQDAKLNAFLPAPYLYRARASLLLGKRDEALLDLERGIVEIERQPLQLPGLAAASPVDDAGEALFDDAIRLTLDRGDRNRAFQYAERRLAQSGFGLNAAHPPAIEDLQRRLRGTATIVLHITSLSDEVVVFAVAGSDAIVARSPISRAHLVQLAAAAENGDAATLRALFDVLIRPSARILDRGEEVIVIADRRLERVPFAALYDAARKRHLIQNLSVAIAPSAAVLDNIETSAPREITAITLPSGERVATNALPETGGEVNEIVPLYAEAHVISTTDATYASLHEALRRDAVVHIAGHTERQQGSDDTALRFAGGERATWSRIAADSVGRNTIVVLAACETLRGSASPHIRSLSLGAAFAAAGAGSVIGTLTPIGDADARELFLAIHRRLSAGESPAQALRHTQLDAITSGRLPAWQSIALLTRCIQTPRIKGRPSWARS